MQYKDTRFEKSAPGLNKCILDMSGNIEDKKILVIGSGRGVLEKMILDKNKNCNITSVDYYCALDNDIKKYVKFNQIDLNIPNFFNQISSTFDVVFCVEIIEHLFSPYHFLYNISDLLKSGGKAYITTPNVEGSTSRIFHLIYGKPLGFLRIPKPGEHFSPIYHYSLEYYVNILDMKVEIKTHYSSCFEYFKRAPSFRSFILLFLWFFLHPFMLNIDGNKRGYTTVYTLSKK